MESLSPSESESKAESILGETLADLPEEMDISEIGGLFMTMTQKMRFSGVRMEDYQASALIFKMCMGMTDEEWQWLNEQAVEFLLQQMGGKPEFN